MRHCIRDRKGRFAKAQQEIQKPEQFDKQPLLKTSLQAAAVLLLTLIGAGLATALLVILSPK